MEKSRVRDGDPVPDDPNGAVVSYSLLRSEVVIIFIAILARDSATVAAIRVAPPPALGVEP